MALEEQEESLILSVNKLFNLLHSPNWKGRKKRERTLQLQVIQFNRETGDKAGMWRLSLVFLKELQLSSQGAMVLPDPDLDTISLALMLPLILILSLPPKMD